MTTHGVSAGVSTPHRCVGVQASAVGAATGNGDAGRPTHTLVVLLRARPRNVIFFLKGRSQQAPSIDLSTAIRTLGAPPQQQPIGPGIIPTHPPLRPETGHRLQGFLRLFQGGKGAPSTSHAAPVETKTIVSTSVPMSTECATSLGMSRMAASEQLPARIEPGTISQTVHVSDESIDGLVKLMPLALVELIDNDPHLAALPDQESPTDIARPADSPILSDDGPELKELSVADFRIAPLKGPLQLRGQQIMRSGKSWRLTIPARVLLIVVAAPIAVMLVQWLLSLTT